MSVLYGADYKLVINTSSNISDHVQSIGLNPTAAELDVTAMGSGGWQAYIAGLKNAQMTLGLFQDYGSSALDSILWPLFATSIPFILTPTSGSPTTSNPSFAGNVIVTQLTPTTAKVGDIVMQSLTWRCTGAIVRATS